MRVSFDEKKARLIVDKSVTDEMLTDAVKKAGGYDGMVIDGR